jgi:uncharacterized protein (DUF927 family)
MGTLHIHTDASAFDTVSEYMTANGFDNIADALNDMRACIDDLESEDRSAYHHMIRKYYSNTLKGE